MTEYTREQFLELYNDLPSELQEAMGSDRTTDTIERLSDQEELDDDQHRAFVKLTGDVLLGLVPPSQYKRELMEAGIEEDSAEKIDQAVRRFVFYPVQDLLSSLYKEQLEVGEGAPVSAEQEDKPTGSDRYREPIEE